MFCLLKRKSYENKYWFNSKIKPEINYDENLKYQEINKYKESYDKEIKSNYDFGFYLDVNKEERTINSIKIDVGTNF